jgi:F-box/WD-40 domain protein MET30
MTTPSATTGYVCDTLPAPRLAGRVLSTTGASESSLRSPSPTSTSVLDPTTVPILDAETLEVVEHDDESPTTQASEETDVSFAPPGRKLCVRHQRMADEGTNLKLQRVSYCTVVSGCSSS